MFDFSNIKTPIDFFKYINNGDNYKMVHKKQYYVWCCKPKMGTKVEGRELGTNEYIISGLKGEQRICTYEEIKAIYVNMYGVALTKEFINKQKKNGEIPWFLLKTAVAKETYWGTFLPIDMIRKLPVKLFMVVDSNNKKYVVEPFNNLFRLRKPEDGVVMGTVNARNIIENMRQLNGDTITEEYLAKKVAAVQRNISRCKSEVEVQGAILLRPSDSRGRIDLSSDYKVIDLNTFALAYNNKGWVSVLPKGLKQDLEKVPELKFTLDVVAESTEKKSEDENNVESTYKDIVIDLENKSYKVSKARIQMLYEKQKAQGATDEVGIQRLVVYGVLNEIVQNYITDWKAQVEAQAWRYLTLEEICKNLDAIWENGVTASEKLIQESGNIINTYFLFRDLAEATGFKDAILQRVHIEMLSSYKEYITQLVQYKLNKYEDLKIDLCEKQYNLSSDKVSECALIDLELERVDKAEDIGAIIDAYADANIWGIKNFLIEILDEISMEYRKESAIASNELKKDIIAAVINKYEEITPSLEKVVDKLMEYEPFSLQECLYDKYRKGLLDIDLSWVEKEIADCRSKLADVEEKGKNDISKNVLENSESEISQNTPQMPLGEQEEISNELTPVEEKNVIESVSDTSELKEQVDINSKRKIQDFGEKIGGAKKDIWKTRGLGIDDLKTLNDAEKKQWVTKQNVWPKPDYNKMIKEGKDKVIVYFQKLIRDACPTQPIPYSLERFSGDDEYADYCNLSIEELYILFIKDIREIAENLTAIPEKPADLLEVLRKKGLINIGYKISVRLRAGAHYTNKLNSVLQYSKYKIEKDMKKKKFGYTEDEKILADYTIGWLHESNWSKEDDRGSTRLMYKPSPFNKYYFYSTNTVKVDDIKDNTYFVTKAASCYLLAINFETKEEAVEFIKEFNNKVEASKKEATKKKGALKPQMLQHIERVGRDVIKNQKIDGDSYLRRFKFRGGEFGNWLNDKERQGSLDYGYEAFCDLADILGIADESISFDGKLAIAFGARGSGSALAHYEPLAKVINLTKMRGAGSLAHEWMHGLDNYIGDILGSGNFESDYAMNYTSKSPAFAELVNVMTKRIKTEEEKKRDDLTEIDKEMKQFKRTIDSYISDEKLGNDAEKIKLKNRYIMELTRLAMGETPVYESANKWLGRKEFYCDKLLEFIDVIKTKLLINSIYRPSMESCIGQSLLYLQAAYKYMKENSQKTVYCSTKFYEDAKELDKGYSKAGHNGYWQSIKEMFARAGASYIYDKLKEQGRRNDYLCGHAEMNGIELNNGNMIYTSPQGEERKAINAAFDRLFKELKDKEILKSR